MAAVPESTCRILGLYLLLFSSFSRLSVQGQASESSQEIPYSKKHSLLKPYQVMGTNPNWEIYGSTMILDHCVRLTSDHQGLSGGIFNQVPINVSDWEAHLHFKIHGKGEALFGDGMAVWFRSSKLQSGPVYGGSDYFIGLGIFLDTYKNHKEHQKQKHSHPLIAVMVNNGSLKFNHDRDGIPGVVSWCEAKVRKISHETHMSIRYENNELHVQTDIEGGGKWKPCVHLRNLYLPLPGYFGLSASTGDLSDNHDIISFKVYELDTEPNQERRAFVPAVSYEGPAVVLGIEQGMSTWSIFFLSFFGLLGVVFLSSIIYLYWQDRKDDRMARQKRLY